jgi:hypothetical protein
LVPLNGLSYNLETDNEDEGNESYDNEEPVDTSSDDEDNVTLASIKQNKEHKKVSKEEEIIDVIKGGEYRAIYEYVLAIYFYASTLLST